MHVARKHVKPGAGQVSLIGIMGFKDQATKGAAKHIWPEQTSILRGPLSSSDLSKGLVAALCVDQLVAGKNMMHIGVHGVGLTASPPTHRPAVLAIVKTAFLAHVGATVLVLTQAKLIGTGCTFKCAIDVPDFSIKFQIGIAEKTPDGAVRKHIVPLDQLMQVLHQCPPRTTYSGIIVRRNTRSNAATADRHLCFCRTYDVNDVPTVVPRLSWRKTDKDALLIEVAAVDAEA